MPAAAVVETWATTIIVTAKTGTTIVAMVPIRVDTPSRVPEVARTPLRQRPGLGLCGGSRTQTGGP